ncbi:MAG: M48 family metalloprotease [Pseudomonadota bacterium]
MRFLKPLAFLSVCCALSACATNAVTGKNELVLVGGNEIAMGQQEYGPTIQSQGGAFIHDSALTSYVNRIGQAIARNSDRRLPYEFTVINSSEPNAWALPGGKMAINRGMLLQMSSEAELAAVLAHEIVHAAAGHSRQQMQSATLLNLGLQLANTQLQGAAYKDIAMQSASIGAKVLSSKYSQSQELEADQYGMKYMARAGFNPKGAVDIQRTFLRLSKERGMHSDGLSNLFSSHPPSALRVQKNSEHLLTLPNTKSMGVSSYQQAIAKIKRLQPAYDLFQKGAKAVAKKQYSTALIYANQAIERFPSEGRFYELKGFCQEKLGQKTSAMSSYNTAIAKNPNYFQGYLMRGMLHQQRGNRASAERDLLASYKLLPSPKIKQLIISLRGGTVQQMPRR